MHRIQALTIGLIIAFCSIARADYVSTQSSVGHGPFDATTGVLADRGQVELWDNVGHGERWVGNVAGTDGYYVAHPTAGKVWIAMSSSWTYAIAYEFEVAPGSYAGRNFVVTTGYTNLGWHPQAVIIRYWPPCPTTNAGSYISYYSCSGNYTPMDGGGLFTAVISDGFTSLGLPFGHYLDLPGNTDNVVCVAHLPNYWALPHPGGIPNDVVAVPGCT